MTYLADACALIVFFSQKNPSLLMPNGDPIMRSAPVSVLPTTIWEIAQKTAIGKLPPVAPSGKLSALVKAQGFAYEPLTWEISERAASLPMHHKDPMDRWLIAAALALGKPVITSDANFPACGVTTIW